MTAFIDSELVRLRTPVDSNALLIRRDAAGQALCLALHKNA